MNDTTPALKPDAAVRALDRLVGTWRISGDATGTVTYCWLPGGFFLVQEGEVELFGHHNRFTEIIGRERSFGGGSSDDIKSRTYTSQGDTLTIWGGGERGSASLTRRPSAPMGPS